jgi:hypothetical protein
VQNSLFHQFNMILPGPGGATIFDSVDGVEFFKFSDVTLSAADVVSGVPSTSPDGTIVTTDGPVIRTAGGDTWSIMNGRVAVNGVADMTTARVVALVYKNGQVWQENADKLWWAKTTPSDQWSPPSGTATPPVAGVTLAVSADNTVLTNNWQTIVDANQHTWSIVNGQVSVDGQIDNTTANVVTLAYEKGQVWQENADSLWWAKTTPADQWSPDLGTSVSPVTGTGVMPLVDPLAPDTAAVSSDSVGMSNMAFMQPGDTMSSTLDMMPASPMSGVSMTPSDLPPTGSPSMDAHMSMSTPMGFMPQDSQTMDMMVPGHV